MRVFPLITLAFATASQAATFKLLLTPAPPSPPTAIETSDLKQKRAPWKHPQPTFDPFPSTRRNQRRLHKGPIGDIENDQYYGNYIRHSKHHHDTSSSSPVIQIPYLNKLTYIVDITLGTPPQPFSLLLSISSPSLIIPSSSCTDENGCAGLQRYNSSLSKTGTPDPENTFRTPHSRFDGSAYSSEDTLSLSGIEITDQDFAQVIAYFPHLSPWGEWDGVLGLAPPSESERDRGMLNPFQQMGRRGMLERTVFALRLPRAEEGGEGEIAFGDVDEAYVGKLKSLPLVRDTTRLSEDGRWVVEARSLEMGSGFVELEGYVAFFETDVPFIGLPAYIVELLDRHMSMEAENLFEMPSMDCEKRDQLKNLIINLGGESFEITPREYTLEVDEGGERGV